jgi:hypothetical protein
VKDEGMNKRNREVDNKGDSIPARWGLQGERELNLCTQKSNREKGENHTQRAHRHSLSHTH